MKAIATLATLLSLALGAPALAEDARGDWVGTLQATPAVTLRLAVHIVEADGALTGTLDSLDQGATGIPIGDIQATDTTLAFAVPTIGGRFTAQWDAAKGAWVGSWSQGGGAIPLTLTRGTAGPVAPPPSLPADWQIPSDAEIGTILDERIAQRPGQGIAVGVFDAEGRRFVARGPRGSRPFDDHTIFEIGSMTKVFTGLLLADMVNKSEVKLDDPVEKYLPAGSKVPERNGRKITLADLATHRSGLPRLPDNMPFAEPANPYADYDEPLLLAFLATHELTRDIGSAFEYSNLGYGLLGHALARAAGTDYATLVARRITGPLGMNDTTIALSPAQQARFATPRDEYLRPTSPWDLPLLAGAGALRSTAQDMLTFLAAAAGATDSPIAEAAALALQPRTGTSGPRGRMGLGWTLAVRPEGNIVSHGGGTGGFRTSMFYDAAKKRGVVVLTNAAVEPSRDDLALHLLIGAPIAPAGTVPPAPPEMPKREAITLPGTELDRLVGRYAFGPGMFIDIARAEDGLTAQITGQPSVPIFAYAPLGFFYRAVPAELRFEAPDGGKAKSVTLVQNGREQLAMRYGG